MFAAARLLPDTRNDDVDDVNDKSIDDDNNSDDNNNNASDKSNVSNRVPTWRKVAVGVIALCLIATNVAGWLDLLLAALIALMLFMVLGVVTFAQALCAINTNVMLTVMSAVGLSEAIVASGVAQLWAG